MIGHCLAYTIGPKTVIILSKNLEPHSHSQMCHIEKVHLKGEKERKRESLRIYITCPTFNLHNIYVYMAGFRWQLNGFLINFQSPMRYCNVSMLCKMLCMLLYSQTFSRKKKKLTR